MFRVNLNKIDIISDEFIERSRKLQSTNNALSSKLDEIQKIFESSLSKEFRKLLETIKKEASESPPYIKKVHAHFANLGWFVPFYSSSLHIFEHYAKLIDLGKNELIEKEIRNHIRGKLSEIGENVKKVFPKRFRIIKTALEAHENKNYILSIPTLLAQADGMFSDLLNQTFYTNDADKLEDIQQRLLKKFHKYGHQPSTSSLGFLLVEQLQEENIINEDFEEFEKRLAPNSKSEPLNRHYIMHGKSINYDTEENSLKAISLIGLLCDCRKTFTL